MSEAKTQERREETASEAAKQAWEAPQLREIDARMTMSASAIPNNDGSGENTSAAS